MAIYITGDTHGITDIQKIITWYEANKDRLNENDLLLICGDVNIPSFYGVPENKKALPILDKMKIQIAYIDGNHENFEKLNAMPIEEWNGGKVHRQSDNVLHLMRGQIYSINDKKILCIGGATSPDRYRRIEGLDYFREEDIMQCDIDETLNNLKINDHKVDIIITHTIGKEFIYRKMYREVQVYDSYMGGINNFLDYVDDITEYSDWYFGHFHMDVDYIGTKKHAIYNRIVKIS